MIPIQPTATPGRYRLAVTPPLCVGPPDAMFLFGGAGLASALAAIEAYTGRPTVWAAAQYLSYARPGTTLDLDVQVPVAGKYNSQARAITRAGADEIITVNAALGRRTGAPDRQWAQMPDVPQPDACRAMPIRWERHPDDLNSHFERRIATGHFGSERGEAPPSPDGIGRLWVRPRDPAVAIDRLALAVMAWAPTPAATAWTTPSASPGWWPPIGCWPICASTPWTQALPTAACICLPAMAR